MFIFLHSIRTNIRTIRREVFEYSNNIRIFKVARIRIRIVIFVKNYSNIRIIRIFVTTLFQTWRSVLSPAASSSPTVSSPAPDMRPTRRGDLPSLSRELISMLLLSTTHCNDNMRAVLGVLQRVTEI